MAEVLATLPQRDQNLLFQILVSKRDREEILREFEVDHAYWRTLLQRVLDSFQQSRPHDLKDRLLEERTPLLTAKFLGRLTNGQSRRLESIEADLEKIEIAEADEFDKNYPQSPMGRIEAVLERLESSLQSLRPGREQTS